MSTGIIGGGVGVDIPQIMNGHDMGSLFGTVMGTILHYKRGPTAKGPLLRLILTLAHVLCRLLVRYGR